MKRLYVSKKLVLSFLFTLCVSVIVSDSVLAQETQPGDACIAGEAGWYRQASSGSPTDSGNFMVCDGSNWLGFFNFKDSGDVTLGTTGAATLPRGTTAERPGTGVNGMIRYNSTSAKFEGYQANSWQDLITSGAGLFENVSNVVRAKSSDVTYATDDFVFGSPQLADDTDFNHDNRMFFDKSKGAFRAGEVQSTEWDDVNVGGNSVAMGLGAMASGSQSIAIGRDTIASTYSSIALGQNSSVPSGNYGMALGSNALSSGSNSVSIGTDTVSSGTVSVAIGSGTTSSGSRSTAMGYKTTASGNYSTAMGYYSSAGGLASFSVGQEVSALGDYSVAFGLGNSSGGNPDVNMPKVSGVSSFGIFMGDQTGIDLATANTMAILGGDFIIGSYQLDDTATGSQDSRMFFDVSKSAFRAGMATGAQWDAANVGGYSTALGGGTTASALYSTAIGEYAVASGRSSVSLGGGVASGDNSTALNLGTASGDVSLATGRFSTASGYTSTAMGSFTSAGGYASVAMGMEANALGDNSFAFGLGNPTDANRPQVSGNRSFGIFMGDQSGVDVAQSNAMVLMGGKFGIGTTTPSALLHTASSTLVDTAIFERSGQTTDFPRTGLRALTTKTTDMADGFGSGIAFNIKDNAAVNNEIGWIGAVRDGADNSGALIFQTVTTGTVNERMRISNGGEVGIGGTSDPTEELVVSAEASASVIELLTYNSSNGSFLVGKRARNTEATPQAVNSGNSLFTIGAYGHDGTGWSSSRRAGIIFRANQDWTGTAQGAKIQFETTPDGSTTRAVRMVIHDTGFVGIGDPSPNVELDVAGDIEYTGTIADMSDRRLKTDIVPLSDRGSMLAKLADIDTYSFRMIDDEEGKIEFGVMAQDIEIIFPELVTTANDKMGTKSMNYVGLITPMVEAINEQHIVIDTLQSQVDELIARIEALEASK